MARPLLRRRGFTLAELLVGLVVTSLVLTAVATAVIGVQRSYQAETEVTVTTENGRTALLYLERGLQLAGYGLDPRVAFDVGAVPGSAARDNVTVTGLTYPSNITAVPEVVTDDLAFRYRDPAFLRRGTLVGSTLTVTEPFGVTLPPRKLLLVACPGGAEYAVVRTGGTVAASASSATVSNAPADIAPFVANNNGCLTSTGAAAPHVMMVHEVRLRVVNLGGRPWLVAFRDLTADVSVLTADNFDPIAADVETFQVAFAMNRPRATGGCCAGQAPPDPGSNPGNANWVVPDVAGETLFAQPGNVLGTLPDYRTSYEDVQRFVGHPANVRAVHVSMVLRGSRLEPNARRASRQGPIFNWTPSVTPVNDGFFRTTLHTAVSTSNLASRSFFVPALRSAADLRDLNSWGG